VRERYGLEKAPFSLKILGDIVLCGGKHLLDGNVDTKIRS
jgi:hypothetical protein